MTTDAGITIDMDRACSRCGKKGTGPNGLYLKDAFYVFGEKQMKTEAEIQPPRQPKLIPMSDAEVAKFTVELSGMVGEYLQLESEKQAADADWNERMSELWEKIKLHRARIEGAE